MSQLWDAPCAGKSSPGPGDLALDVDVDVGVDVDIEVGVGVDGDGDVEVSPPGWMLILVLVLVLVLLQRLNVGIGIATAFECWYWNCNGVWTQICRWTRCCPFLLLIKLLFIQRSEGIAVDPSAAMANDTIYQVFITHWTIFCSWQICLVCSYRILVSFALFTRCLKQIQQQLNMLKKSTQECGVEIEKTRQMQEHHSINFYKHHQISG